MKAMPQHLNDWLHREAHVTTGRPFQMDDCSCVPVAPETQSESETPVGFLVTRGADVTYIPAQTPDGEQMMTAWTKLHSSEEAAEIETLPAEYWYG